MLSAWAADSGQGAGALQRLEGSRFGHWIDLVVGGLLILLGFYLLWRV
jgi:hypothetical protein